MVPQAKMRSYVKIVYTNGENRVAITGRAEFLVKLPDSVLPTVLHKQILSFGKYKSEHTCLERQYKVYVLNEQYRQVSFKASGNDLFLWEAVFSDQLFQHGWTLAGLSARVAVRMKKTDLKEFFIVTEWIGIEAGENGPQEDVGCVSLKLDYEDKCLIFTGRKEILNLLPLSVYSGKNNEVGSTVQGEVKMVRFDEHYSGMKVPRKLDDLSEFQVEESLMKNGWKPVASSFHPSFEHSGHSVFQKWLAPQLRAGLAMVASAPPLEPDDDLFDLRPPPSYEEVMQLEKKNKVVDFRNGMNSSNLDENAEKAGVVTIQFDHFDDKVIFSGSLDNLQHLPQTVFPAALKDHLSSPRNKETTCKILPQTGRYPQSKIHFLDKTHRVVKMKNISAVSMEGLVGDNLLRRNWTLVGYSGRILNLRTGHHAIEKWRLPDDPSLEIKPNCSEQQPGFLTIEFNYEYSHITFLGRADVFNSLPESVVPRVIVDQLTSANVKAKIKHVKEVYRIGALAKKPLCVVEVNRKLDYLSEPSITEMMSQRGWTLVACCANVKDRRDDFQDHFIILQKWSRPI